MISAALHHVIFFAMALGRYLDPANEFGCPQRRSRLHVKNIGIGYSTFGDSVPKSLGFNALRPELLG